MAIVLFLYWVMILLEQLAFNGCALWITLASWFLSKLLIFCSSYALTQGHSLKTAMCFLHQDILFKCVRQPQMIDVLGWGSGIFPFSKSPVNLQLIL